MDDPRIYLLGRWDDPVPVQSAAIAVDFLSDIHRCDLDDSLSRCRPQEEESDLLQGLKRLMEIRDRHG